MPRQNLLEQSIYNVKTEEQKNETGSTGVVARGRAESEEKMKEYSYGGCISICVSN
jgi:hypothetical protein